jgi:hypothetical protein
LLTGFGKFPGGQLPQGAVRTILNVVDAPRRDDLLRMHYIAERRDMQTLVPQLAVEGLDVAVVRGLSRPREVELHAARVRPVFENARMNSVP